ncbi:MAG: translation initiation factor IF-2 [Planctomycetes bacterium]|nr:translation initiation factor IF-2 [Planctomycetota bacterium]
MTKVKVFKLAKQFGYKSAEFVDIMRNIGFPVSSYQASVEEWDVPIIEERLRKGGLLKDGSEESSGAAKKDDAKKDAGATSSWDALVSAAQSAPAADPEPEVEEAAPVVEEPKAEEVVEPEVVEEVVAEEPVAEESPVVEEPVAAEEPAPAPTPEPVVEEPKAEEPAVDEKPVVEEKPAAPAPKGARVIAPPASKKGTPKPKAAPAPTPKPAAAETPAAKKPAAAKPAAKGDQAAGAKPASKDKVTAKKAESPPVPKPKRAATRVGRIDLAALGLIKSQQEQRKRGSTFTDMRDRESARRREMRQKQRERLRDRRHGKLKPKMSSTIDRKGDVILQLPITVKSFSAATGIGVSHVIRRLMKMGVMTTINSVLDEETVELIADDFDIPVAIRAETDIERELMEDIMAARHAVDDDSMQDRPPVIAFMGHVDHGKTSCIDAIRETRVAVKEAGGITQHVGAYVATLDSGKTVTILDTPGHAAFTSMRQRGAQATDIAVLVVAADDGVMPQTEEAAAHASEAGTPIVVAINKCDSPNANPDQVRSQLAGIGLQCEDWGGDVGMIEVSALKKQGMEELLERVLLEAEVMGLKAHAKGDAVGIVLESKLEKGKGKVASVLITDGTLQAKNVVLAGHTFGKIRLMFDHMGKPLKSAGPSTPVDLLGLDELPPVGETFYVISDLKSAKTVAEKRALHKKEIEMSKGAGVTLQNLFEKIDESNAQHFKLILKADVHGSLEVIKQSLKELSTEEVIVDVIHSGVGGITETDVVLADTAGAVILGFGVVPEGKARKEAERLRIEIRRYDVIYELLEDMEKAVEGMLAPDTVEQIVGHAEVQEVYRSSRWGVIAGCKVVDGVVKRACNARLIRDGRIVFEGPFGSLRHFKDDVREVAEGNDCGIKIENFEDIKAGDTIEAVEVLEVVRTLEDVKEVEAEAKAKAEAQAAADAEARRNRPSRSRR